MRAVAAKSGSRIKLYLVDKGGRITHYNIHTWPSGIAPRPARGSKGSTGQDSGGLEIVSGPDGTPYV